MAASAKAKGAKMSETKPKLSQSDLRKLMKEKLESSDRRKKKIESPFAKYNNGELFCVLCSTKIKSELLWAAHINGRNHKENQEVLKRKKKEAEDLLMKRPSTPPPIKPVFNKQAVIPPPEKRQKSDSSPNDTSASKPSPSAERNPAKGIISSYYEAEEEEEGAASTSQLPSDFFDSGVPLEAPEGEDKSKADKTSEPNKKPATTAEALPEGFFDDPILDAKVRKVEYKDPMDDEWDKFQKAIASESTVSQALMEENDEESKAERQIDEIDEQIHNWARVEALQRRKDGLNRKQEASTSTAVEEPISTEEGAFDEFLDWRSKGAWR